MSDGNEKLYNFKKRSDESAVKDFGPSLTVQSDAVDADINVIVARYGITGTVPQGLRLPEYGDYDGIDDYQSALEAVEEARKSFMSIPANIRSQFDNDPGLFLEFAADPSNFDELVKMGLAKAPEVIEPAPLPAPATPPSP